MNKGKKASIITFKADESLQEALSHIPNRSEFIREAILTALDNICPLCQGNGILTPDQKKHWHIFEQNHHVEECADCQAPYIMCSLNDTTPKHPNNGH